MTIQKEALELCLRGSNKPCAYACGTCGLLFGTYYPVDGAIDSALVAAKQLADMHCGPRFCGCGVEIDELYWQVCKVCRDTEIAMKEQEAFEKAKKVSIEEYPASTPVFCEDGPNSSLGEGYYSDINDLLEAYEVAESDMPIYVWGTTTMKLHVDAEQVLEDALSCHHEDAYDELADGAQRKLQGVLDAFCETQSVKTFMPDYSTAILLSPVE